jgi:dTDP-4-dehydrorhamnose reductase
MKVLILGASGMLGTALVNNLISLHSVTTLGRTLCQNSHQHITIEADSKALGEHLKENFYDTIINCVAIIDHIQCNKNFKKCLQVNSLINETIVNNIKARTRLIYISSDAVFSDAIEKRTPSTTTSPQSYYGLSKDVGEKILLTQKRGIDFYIIRTTIVGFSPKNKGFVDWLLHSAKNNKTTTLFTDVRFNPISIWDLATEIEYLICEPMLKTPVLHINGRESMSKYEFGLELCDNLQLESKTISAGRLSDFSARAERCYNQILDTTSYTKETKRILPGVKETMQSFKKHYNEYY